MIDGQSGRPASPEPSRGEGRPRRWIRVEAANVPLREGRAVRFDGREIAVFNLGDGEFLATDNICPHQGGPLCDGIVTSRSVVCPLHAWKVNLETGCVERPAAMSDRCVATYPVRVEDGTLVIGITEGPIISCL